MKNKFSSWTLVISGNPQGSVLGPTLFYLFINDLPDVCSSMCHLFADDAKMSRNVSSAEETNELQDDLNRLMEWAEIWQLSFNLEKCKSLHIGKHVYKMKGKTLKQVVGEKDLGLNIDNELKFHTQTTAAIKKKANTVLGVIKRSFAYFDNVTLPLLSKSLVRSHLEYGNVVWGSFYKEDTKKIERVQRRATKLIPEIHNRPYQERLIYLKLPSLVYRRSRGDMIYP